MRRIVIYHDNCVDGFTAAWVAWLTYGEHAEYVPATYGAPPPPVAHDDRVLIVDFSYPREVLLRLHDECSELRVLDHHKTAQEALAGLDFCTFDMRRSGAGIAWDELHGSKRAPIVNYVEDRDLWKWELPSSREVSAYLSTVKRDFREWSVAAELIAVELDRVISIGSAVLRVTEQYVESHVEYAQTISLAGHLGIPCVNTTFATSELVGKLAERALFAVGWFERSDGKFVYSLRSRGEGGADVSAIAKRFGGGGHRNAAGFTLDRPVHR